MNFHKKIREKNIKNRKMYTPEGYICDPPNSICPYCGEKQKACSYINSLSRAWARDICKKKNITKGTENK